MLVNSIKNVTQREMERKAIFFFLARMSKVLKLAGHLFWAFYKDLSRSYIKC